MYGQVYITSSKLHQIARDDEFLQGEEESMKNFFNKHHDEMTPNEIIMYNTYKEVLHLKSLIAVKDPLDSIPLDLAMKKKLDIIYALYHEYETKTSNDALFKPYILEIIPISLKNDTKNSTDINEDTTNTTVQEESDDAIIHVEEEDADVVSVAYSKKQRNSCRFYKTYDVDGDGHLDRNDFNCQCKINGKLVELTETEVEESLHKMKHSTNNRIYEILHNENYVDESFSRIAAYWYTFIMLTVVLSIVQSVCDTVQTWHEAGHQKGDANNWEKIDIITSAILTFEYLLTICFVRNKCSYVLTFQKVIDLWATIPIYIWYCIYLSTGEEWDIIGIIGTCVKTLRILRMFKSRSLSNPYVLLMLQSVKEFILGTGLAVAIIVSIVCLFLGSLMYAVQSWDPKSGYTNIFMGMWFVLVTMSTVGYGDMSPTTWYGYVSGLITIVVGVTVFSMILQVTGQYYVDLLDGYNDEVKDIKRILFSLMDENADKFRYVLRYESGEKLYSKVEYALRYEKHKLIDI